MASVIDDKIKLLDPREIFPKPPFGDQQKTATYAKPSEMKPRPDHGEESYHGSGKLKGLSALITGGDSGIGRAIAIAYAREGANVAINHLNENDGAEETIRLIEEAGVKGCKIRGDIRDENFCVDLVDQAASRLGGLEILINNAAYQETADELEDFSTKVFDRIFKTNVYATFWLSKQAMNHLPPGGSIINTVSIQGYDPSPNLLPYASSKSALIGMTKAMAKMLMEKGVRVNAVAPGPVWTPLIPGTMPEDKIKNFGDNTLFGRPAQPVELAPLYVWLASPEASYVTAEVYEATGGRTPV